MTSWFAPAIAVMLTAAAAMTWAGRAAAERCEYLSIQVSDDAVPTFSWEGRCRVRELRVAELDGERTVWSIDAGGQFGSPVVYGEAPSHARQRGPEPLQPGVNTQSPSTSRSASKPLPP